MFFWNSLAFSMIQRMLAVGVMEIKTKINKWNLIKFKRCPKESYESCYLIMEKAREFQKNIYFCFIDYAKAFDCVDHNKLWKILKEMGIPDHLACLLRNL